MKKCCSSDGLDVGPECEVGIEDHPEVFYSVAFTDFAAINIKREFVVFASSLYFYSFY